MGEAEPSLGVSIRPAAPDDEAFVMSAWLRCHRDFGDWPRLLHPEKYYAQHKATIMRLLARSTTMVACNPDRPSQALGFVCYDGTATHWVYVKDVWRRIGIGRELFSGAPYRCSHWTSVAADWLRKGDCYYDPFALETR